MTLDQRAIHDEVRSKYAEAAIAAAAGRTDTEAQAGCCTPGGSIQFGELLYAPDERAGLPPAAVLASLGCGNPMAVADLREIPDFFFVRCDVARETAVRACIAKVL